MGRPGVIGNEEDQYVPQDLLLLAALFIYTLGIFLGQIASGYPIANIGQQTPTCRVWGYDSSLGAFAPSISNILHLGTYLSCCAGWLYFCKFCLNWQVINLHSLNTMDDKLNFVIPATAIFACVRQFFWRSGRYVSHPGGARSSKIMRQPRWEDRVTNAIDGSSVKQKKEATWRCAVAQDSHEVTSARFRSGDGDNSKKQAAGSKVEVGLSGEPFGRQMWTCSEKQEQRDDACDDNEALVETLAAGGRTYAGFNPSVNPNSGDRIFRAQQIRNYLAKPGNSPPDLKLKPKKAREAAKKALQFYSMLQSEDGHWAGDYGGPHFLMPGIIIAWYVMGQPEQMLDRNQRAMMKHYLTVHQQSDGGWGTHIESPSTMFGTVLCYVSMRLLGANANDEACKRGREFIQNEGGAIYTSSWAKFWLCLLGCMEWEGHNSVPPEMWLLPNWFPFHPGRLWCHCRMVYLPMGYLYGSRFTYSKAENDELIAAIRNEIYCEPYASISWDETRQLVASMDNYSPLPFVMKFFQNALAYYESLSIVQPFKNWVRAKGLTFCIEYMHAEDLQTNYIDIGPVNKALNMVSAFHAAKNDIHDPAVQNHMMRIPDYLWLAEDGLKMQGYNGSQCWDTSFAIQAVMECNFMDAFPEVSTKVWSYLERTQILSTDVSRNSPAYAFESCLTRDKFYRHVSKGGWPFSTSAHGWPISDCTGEGLKAVLALTNCNAVSIGLEKGLLKPITSTRLEDAVNVILTLQNEDGGWATYENNRGFGWYEQLNPSEVFGDIMIDYSYVECSMASLTALAEFHEKYPSHRESEITSAIQRGRNFMKRIQRKDGSWYGSWACCFCYGCWFGIEGLIAAGESPKSVAIQKCCDYLLSHQRANGGWGEDFTSCYDKSYAKDGMMSYGDEGSGAVNTAWALLALSAAKCHDVDAVRRGVKYLISRQLPSGDWPQEGISGVFNRACGITYTSYRNVFPMWALGRCTKVYGDSIDNA